MMTNDQPPGPKSCDTVRLAIRLRVRRISCSFGLSRLAENAGSYRDVWLDQKKAHRDGGDLACCIDDGLRGLRLGKDLEAEALISNSGVDAVPHPPRRGLRDHDVDLQAD
jgi:hypothetical protein